MAAGGYVAPGGIPANPKEVRCAVETMATTGLIMVTGEVRTQAYVDVPGIAREVLREIGYDRAKYGFDCDTCGVLNTIHEQSPDIAQGVDESWETQNGEAVDPYDQIGAGDQGMMFGYACNETKTLMPLPHYLASRLAERLSKVRKDGIMPNLRPARPRLAFVMLTAFLPRSKRWLYLLSTPRKPILLNCAKRLSVTLSTPCLGPRE